MNNLFFEMTKSTPLVDFNIETNTLRIEGYSYPENAFKFYKPIFDWLEEFKQEEIAGDIHVDLLIHYLNTSSSKSMMNIFDLLEEAYLAGKKIKITWFYEKQNDTLFEVAEEFKEDLALPFEIKALENKEK